MAGFCGLDPGPYTARELIWLAEGRDKRNWNYACAILAALANQFKNKGDTPVDAAQLHPYGEEAQAARGKESGGKKKSAGRVPVSVLKDWIEQQRPPG